LKVNWGVDGSVGIDVGEVGVRPKLLHHHWTVAIARVTRVSEAGLGSSTVPNKIGGLLEEGSRRRIDVGEVDQVDLQAPLPRCWHTNQVHGCARCTRGDTGIAVCGDAHARIVR